jgi:hypothetical protein
MALVKHLLNKNVNKGCDKFVPTVEFEHVCSTCQHEEYAHKNRVIEKNGYHQLRIKNRETQEYCVIDVNINWQIRDLIDCIEKKFGVESPMEVYLLHLDLIPHMESPFHVMKGMRLRELDVDFRCNVCTVTYSIGNKRRETMINCAIVSLCLPCACLILPQYAFDLVSEALMDGIIYAGTCMCAACCCRRASKEDAVPEGAVSAGGGTGDSSAGADLTEPLIAPSAPEMPPDMIVSAEATPEMADRA